MLALLRWVFRWLQWLRGSVLAGCLGVLVACGGGGEAPSFTIGGQVSGMPAGGSVVLQNGTEQLTVSANGVFTFRTVVALGGNYSATVISQSAGQTCSLASSSGAGAGINSNITSIRIACSVFSYAVGGSVSGLQNSTLTLLNNGTNSITVSGDGSFTFATPVAFGGSYNVTVGNQPVGQNCSVVGGSGAGVNTNVTGVSILCSTSSFSIGGNVSGASNSVTLSLNGGSFLSLGVNGTFSFSPRLAFDGSYNVAVSTNPFGQTCTVNNGVGSNVIADVTNINVLCSTNTYTISGNVSGLQGAVTLNLNGGSPLSISGNGAFTFATRVSFAGNYNVTVATQPIGEICSVSNGSGSLVIANVQNISINCVPSTFTIGGSVSGLQGTLTLNLNGASPLSISSNGAFNFPTPVSFGSNYNVTVAAQPLGQNCLISNGSGSSVNSNVQNISITCAPITFNVTAAVTGLTVGETLTLRLTSNNVSFDVVATSLTLASIAAFPAIAAWNDRVNYGGSFSISLPSSSLPSGKICAVNGAPNNIWTNVTSDVSNIPVSCVFPSELT